MSKSGGGGQLPPRPPFSYTTDNHYLTRKTLGIETASSSSMQNLNFIERSKVRKSDHAFLPKGIQIKDLTQAFCQA